MNKKRREVIENNKVSKMMTYSLNGYSQKVLFDGKNETSPVLLNLHGGPGMPIPFSVGCRGMFPDFTDHVIMAYWDQLGCGINDYVIDDTFTIDDYVKMTVDLIKEIKKEFPNNQLILLGMSWGSVLTAKVASEVPELIDQVLVYGQILTELIFNSEVYTSILQSSISSSHKVIIDNIKNKEEHTTEDVKMMAKLIRKYTEGYQAKTKEKTPMLPIIGGLLSSPDYTFKDFKAIVVNGFMKNTSIWKELIAIDLSKELEKVQVPYHILQGSTDIVTSTKNIVEFVEASHNSNLRIFVVEGNGHIPGGSGVEQVLQESLKLGKVVVGE